MHIWLQYIWSDVAVTAEDCEELTIGNIVEQNAIFAAGIGAGCVEYDWTGTEWLGGTMA